MKKLIASILTTQVLLSSAIAGVNDVVPKNFKHGSTYVRVTKVKNNSVRFEKCIKGYEASSCTQIGRKSSYSLQSLVKQRQKENLEATGTIAADVVIIAGAVLGGAALAGGIAGGAASLGSGIWFIDLAGKAVYGTALAAGGGVGAALGGAATLINPLNPSLQIAQARTLNTDILNDQTVVRNDINYYIDNLETVLEKIR